MLARIPCQASFQIGLAYPLLAKIAQKKLLRQMWIFSIEILKSIWTVVIMKIWWHKNSDDIYDIQTPSVLSNVKLNSWNSWQPSLSIEWFQDGAPASSKYHVVC